MCIIFEYFRHHEHGALSIYNSQDVTVKNCKFLNNTSGSYFTRKPYQGSSGGLSVGYHFPKSKLQLNNISIVVSDCTFVNNFAAPPTALRLTSTQILIGRIFSGRGAAMSVLVNVNTALNFILNNSVFVNNSAYNFGGGIYCLTAGGRINQTYLWSNNQFIGNRASIAGAFSFISLLNLPVRFILYDRVYNCTFVGNIAHSEVAGAATVYPLYGLPNSVVVFEDCKFFNNSALIYGGAVDISTYNFFNDRIVFPITFIDWCVSVMLVVYKLFMLLYSIFDGNTAADASAINLAFYSAKFDNVTFGNNRESAVRVSQVLEIACV